MAGHSKWANIQHRKGRQDAKRGKIFTKLVRELTVAARLGGSDPEGNPRLRSAIAAARAQSMPNENIKRAIDKGAGTGDTDAWVEITYEGYGPSGVAVLVDALTDNRNRTTADVRHIFSKSGGNLGETGAVGWQFERQGLVTFAVDDRDEDEMTELASEAGADDVEQVGETCCLTTAPDQMHAVADVLQTEGVQVQTAEWIMVPTNEMELDAEVAAKVIRMIDLFEDNDDVQKVWTNAANLEIAEEVQS